MSKEGGKTHMHITHNLLENMILLQIKVNKYIIDFLIFIYKGYNSGNTFPQINYLLIVKSNKNIKIFLACLNRLLLTLFYYVLSTINIRKANIMILQFEWWWSTIPTITHKKINKIRTTTSNIKSLNTKNNQDIWGWKFVSWRRTITRM